jgi:hypothetical protein
VRTDLPGPVPVERDGDGASPAADESAERGDKEGDFEVVGGAVNSLKE